MFGIQIRHLIFILIFGALVFGVFKRYSSNDLNFESAHLDEKKAILPEVLSVTQSASATEVVPLGTKLEKSLDASGTQKIIVDFDPDQAPVLSESDYGKTYKKLLEVDLINQKPSKFLVEFEDSVDVSSLIFVAQGTSFDMSEVYVNEEDSSLQIFEDQKDKRFYEGDWVALTQKIEGLRSIGFTASPDKVGQVHIYVQVF